MLLFCPLAWDGGNRGINDFGQDPRERYSFVGPRAAGVTARDPLAPTSSGLSKGFGTTDLLAARNLLNELEPRDDAPSVAMVVRG